MIDLFYTNLTMNYEILRILFAVIGTSISAYFDIFNKKNIPDLVLYIFLVLSLIIVFIDFNLTLIIYSIGCALIVGIIGYLFYKAGQIGGADVFILCSLALLLPVQPKLFGNTSNINLPFIFSIISVAGFVFIIYVLFKYTPMVLKRKEKIELKRIIYSLPLICIFLIFILLSKKIDLPAIYLILIGFLICVSIYFSIFKERFMKTLIEKIPLNKIENEDVIAIEYMNKKIVEKYNIPRVVSSSDLKRLKNAKISKYPVYTKLPMFVPFILIGLLFSLYFGSLLFLF
ncbi:hypothetical protein KO317_00400 [Candidatus Micrarchaeota archaeon]|jgi:Flp pilus assembly protein protease CpaA|nr:hypothetical protein [Candidatus Micrarchaeota archaeon]